MAEADVRGKAIGDLPSALERRQEISDRIGDAVPVVFLDYDGTLTPIVDDPREALMPDATRRAVERLSARCPVAVVSGRDLSEVRELVGVEGIHYAGSHGFDSVEPDGERHRRGVEYVPALARSAHRLESLLEDVAGVWLERKAFAVAVHYRRLEDPSDEERVREAVDRVVEEIPRIRATGGKKIFEVRPNLEWDKGRAILWMLDELGLGGEDRLPLYLGDDVTDEDGFRALREVGVGIVVRGEDDDRATAAEYALADPDEVRTFLRMLADLLEDRGADA